MLETTPTLLQGKSTLENINLSQGHPGQEMGSSVSRQLSSDPQHMVSITARPWPQRHFKSLWKMWFHVSCSAVCHRGQLRSWQTTREGWPLWFNPCYPFMWYDWVCNETFSLLVSLFLSYKPLTAHKGQWIHCGVSCLSSPKMWNSFIKGDNSAIH